MWPSALHSCNCPDTFHGHLKTHYFQQAFLSSRHFADSAHTCKFHLLTYLLILAAVVDFAVAICDFVTFIS